MYWKDIQNSIYGARLFEYSIYALLHSLSSDIGITHHIEQREFGSELLDNPLPIALKPCWGGKSKK